VTVPQLWNQLPVTVQATSTNVDCFKQAPKNEDAPVSMSGRFVADDSTSDELLYRGL